MSNIHPAFYPSFFLACIQLRHNEVGRSKWRAVDVRVSRSMGVWLDIVLSGSALSPRVASRRPIWSLMCKFVSRVCACACRCPPDTQSKLRITRNPASAVSCESLEEKISKYSCTLKSWNQTLRWLIPRHPLQRNRVLHITSIYGSIQSTLLNI